MNILNFKAGVFSDIDVCIETEERWEPTDYGYDEPDLYEFLNIKGVEYVIDDVKRVEYATMVEAHRYINDRTLKIDVSLVRSDFCEEWSYVMRIWKL